MPYTLERLVPVVAEGAGFDASIENVDLSLLRGHVTLEGLRLASLSPAGTGAPAEDLFSLGRLFVNLLDNHTVAID